MPNKDGTGPEGKGPMTGRGAGNCNDKPAKSARPKDGRGAGARRGQGRA
ncbi:DUF5320 domain-containing protein [Candidatus Parcubacteria bacterium]|jgi:hypothetical protein|nr:DUF5320 domain-containing protein [Candidatus Parcubacteria bacterium]